MTFGSNKVMRGMRENNTDIALVLLRKLNPHESRRMSNLSIILQITSTVVIQQ